MQSREVHNGFLLKLSRGEKVISSLVEFCQEKNISSAWLQGVGAVKNTNIGYYDLEKREYFFTLFPEDREVASMSGNVALVDGKPFVHLHAVLSACGKSLASVGAHIQEAEVAVTLEVYLTVFDAPLERAYDEETGLKLLTI
jgi:predicted DNA-binding protein with PD1-like motif